MKIKMSLQATNHLVIKHSDTPGVAFYQSMQYQGTKVAEGIGLLGEETLFESCFICIKQGHGDDIQIMYGKSPAGAMVGTVLATHKVSRHSLLPMNKERFPYYLHIVTNQKPKRKWINYIIYVSH